MGWITRFLYGVVIFLAVLFGAVLYWRNAPFLWHGPERAFLLTKPVDVRHSLLYLPAFYVHIVTGSLVLVAGVIQFSTSLRRRSVAFHRNLGKVYVGVILMFAAPSGLLMALQANGGLSASIGFSLLAILWWYFTWKGWQTALAQNWTSHRAFMMRSYALTFAAVTLRLYSFIGALMGYRGEFAYNIIVWLCWPPNLILVECWLRYTLSGRQTDTGRTGTDG